MLDIINRNSVTLKEMKRTYNIIEIFSLKSQSKTLWILTYVWFTCGFCFFGMLINIEKLGGSLILNTIVMFSGEITSELLTGYLADQYGRLIILKIFGFIGGLAFIFHEIFSNIFLKAIFIFFTSFGFAGNFNVVYLYSPEIIPTTIRSTTMGYLFFMNKIGPLIVPTLTMFVPHLPIVFGVLSIISSYLCFKLTETLGREIEDDIPELMRQKSFLSFNQRKSEKSYGDFKSRGSNEKLMNRDSYFNLKG